MGSIDTASSEQDSTTVQLPSTEQVHKESLERNQQAWSILVAGRQATLIMGNQTREWTIRLVRELMRKDRLVRLSKWFR